LKVQVAVLGSGRENFISLSALQTGVEVKTSFALVLVFLLGLSLPTAVLARDSSTADEQYRKLLADDDALMQDLERLSGNRSWLTRSMLRARLRRVEAEYRQFLSDHPKHVRAMVAYGSFLCDLQREDEAIIWWKKAIVIDPDCAAAYNDLGEVYGHTGRAGDALRLHQKAYELDPAEPVYRFNWANTCILYRNDAHEVYGWDTDEIFRRSLEQFRKARDLAPQDFEFSSAYAESFYLMKAPDWQEMYAAWKYCLDQPLQTNDRQRVYSYLARACMHLDRLEEAKTWLMKMDAPEVQALRQTLERRLAQPAVGKPQP
jgi:tetratricopeptide (TPR) repeat protein